MAFFEKYLSKVDVKKQMAIPSKFTDHLPQYEGGRTIFFPVHDVSGQVWQRFGYYVRRKDQEHYSKPVLQADWRRYVRAKRLVSGDKIIFRVEEDAVTGARTYKIAAKKRVRLLGTTVAWSEEF
ncbi:hypothetical protein PTKIN_Ptkin14bG0162800 [Pterospermum kingtungense]